MTTEVPPATDRTEVRPEEGQGHRQASLRPLGQLEGRADRSQHGYQCVSVGGRQPAQPCHKEAGEAAVPVPEGGQQECEPSERCPGIGRHTCKQLLGEWTTERRLHVLSVGGF